MNGQCPAPSGAIRTGDSATGHRLAKLVGRVGEQLFHYRYVRAELIERALKRHEADRGEQR